MDVTDTRRAIFVWNIAAPNWSAWRRGVRARGVASRELHAMTASILTVLDGVSPVSLYATTIRTLAVREFGHDDIGPGMSSYLASLHRAGFIERDEDGARWRITMAGRDALRAYGGGF
jgi:hypothetical protein